MHYRGYGNRQTGLQRPTFGNATPQNQPIPGTNQELNSTGIGYSFVLDPMKRFARFLVLGSDSPTYYVSEQKLTKDNLKNLMELLKAGRGREVIDLIVEISESGRAPKQQPALFALAYCFACDVHGPVKHAVPQERNYKLHRANHPALFERFPEEYKAVTIGKRVMERRGDTIYARVLRTDKSPKTVDLIAEEDLNVRRMAFEALPRVVRTGTHMFLFLNYVEQFRGWGRGLKSAVAGYYNGMSEDRAAGQVTKYQSREGFAQRDALRLAHPKPNNEVKRVIYEWVTKGWPSVGDEPHPDVALDRIWAFERAKRATSEKEIVDLVLNHKLPREGVPTEWLNSKEVWAALLETMLPEALMRNLATMTRVGLLVPLSDAVKTVTGKLGNEKLLKAARLHPIKVLMALKTYESGHGLRGQHTWTPVPAVTSALNSTFYKTFDFVEPTGKRHVLALDVSGSMSSGDVAGIAGLTPRAASSAMAMVTARAEENYTVMAFSRGFIPLNITPDMRLDDICRKTENLPFDSTDCARPMLWAMENNIETDVFVIYTDSETYANPRIHPVQSLKMYREKFGIPAKLIVVGMTSTQFSIADPNDPGMLDVVGMDAATPSIISGFTRGEF